MDTTASLDRARLDALVATYAPIGARRKKNRRILRLAIAAGAALALGGAFLLATHGSHLLAGISLGDFGVAGLSPAASERLRAERQAFAARIDSLEQKLAGVEQRRVELERQQDDIGRQRESLDRLLAEVDTRLASTRGGGDESSALEKEIAAMAAQRQALEERWTQFEAQGELLAMEIIAVNAQRKELESQRRQIARQQRELAELLDKAEGLYRRSVAAYGGVSPQGTRALPGDSGEFGYSMGSLRVDNGELDSMRGGFTVGRGLDVSFGVTRSGSINGVEQFNNSFTIENMGSGRGSTGLSYSSPMLIQNGSGNYVSEGVLGAMALGFDSIIQNTLDGQQISTTSIYDISLHNVPGVVQGLSGAQALTNSIDASR